MPGADPRGERHGQGAGLRPRHPLQRSAQERRRSSARTARRFPRPCWRASSSATSEGRVHGRRPPTRRASSRRPTGARSSSTRSATCRWTCRRSCCACCRSARSAASAATGTIDDRRAHRRREQPGPAQALRGGPLPRGPLLPAQRHHGERSLRCASGARTSRCSSSTSSRRSRPTRARSARSARTPCGRSSAHHWPGNVRELRNEVQRAAALSDRVIVPLVLSEAVRGRQDDAPPAVAELGREDAEGDGEGGRRGASRRKVIQEALNRCRTAARRRPRGCSA